MKVKQPIPNKYGKYTLWACCCLVQITRAPAFSIRSHFLPRGSLELVRMLNHIGVAASIDTTSHLATQVSQEQRAHGIKSECTPKVLTGLSICNNSLQPHALICFKMLLEGSMEHLYSVCNHFPSHALLHHRKKSHTSTPELEATKIASPILVESKCCCHTLKELQSPLYTVTIPDATSSLAIHSSVTGDYHMSSGNLAISDFHLIPWKELVSSAWEMTCWNACS